MSLSLQAIYDRVKTHLLAQNAKSQIECRLPDVPVGFKTICAYRGDSGRTCAVGCLITDPCYTPDLEGKSFAAHPEVAAALVCSGVLDPEEHRHSQRVDLLSDLQNAHDKHPIAKWPERLSHLAAHYGLTP